eukprot:TRINITY_DN53229_c0_g1_i1.p1 TRINITY_DN53229_c0_g1~~TRINITY_DN53229_c0_g1_i1.p1  ORF type:complete len:651 (+),score=-15.72 TRINITY_DN53229_c0_g1_i1:141-1955(+)
MSKEKNSNPNDGYTTLKKGTGLNSLRVEFGGDIGPTINRLANNDVEHRIVPSNGSYRNSHNDHNRDGSRTITKSITDTPDGHITSLVLKFTTLSEANTEPPSFCVGINGARIGQSRENEVSVPSDAKLAKIAHASIEFYNGSFYLVDRGYECPASVRIGVGIHKRQWVMAPDACFSAGNSAFRSCGLNSDGNLMLEIVEGPLKGERRVVTKKGATIGRSSDNVLSVPDRELSRRHSKVDYDEKNGRFFVCDIGSTNGTYMQLIGPYNGRYKLSLNDHILVGRTGFSLNRYDFGVSEEKGFRQTMEDSSVIIQHLNIGALSSSKMFCPQSFFGVFDGHGGDQASQYLSQKLHVNIATSLSNSAPELLNILSNNNTDDRSGSREGRRYELMDEIVNKCLKESFAKTDADFIACSKDAQHGSTATTCIILGQRLYCANVGDSRTILCRKFQAIPLSVDHKPGREDESKRIRDAGGFVINNRVMGELAVSRAFGDAEFKKGIQSIIGPDELIKNDGHEEDKNWDQPLVIAEPEIQTVTVTESDQFVLLACDGLYDVFTNDEIISFVLAQLKEHGDTQRCCQNLTIEAIRKRNSRDNVSVVLVILNPWY